MNIIVPGRYLCVAITVTALKRTINGNIVKNMDGFSQAALYEIVGGAVQQLDKTGR